MGSFKLKLNKAIDKSDPTLSEDTAGTSSSSVAITDPQLATSALSLENRKQNLTKTYNDQIRDIDMQLSQLREKQIALNMQNANAQKQDVQAQPDNKNTNTEENTENK